MLEIESMSRLINILVTQYFGFGLSGPLTMMSEKMIDVFRTSFDQESAIRNEPVAYDVFYTSSDSSSSSETSSLLMT